jgi:RNA polymerase sigma factor for flagellar operon FliA
MAMTTSAVVRASRRTKTDTRAEPAKEPTVGAATSELWAEYARCRSVEARDRLILRYLPVVRFVAARMAASYRFVDVDDLEGSGVFGLVDAIEKFEPNRGFKFETYAVARIRGAILDELRRIDGVPRRVRATDRAFVRAQELLRNELGREPSRDEVASSLGRRAQDHDRALAIITASRAVRLDAPIASRGQGRERGERLVDLVADPVDPFEEVVGSDDPESTLRGLSDRSRLVMVLHYAEGMTQQQIADVLGVTPSRVCQIHAAAIAQLRARHARRAAREDVRAVS